MFLFNMKMNLVLHLAIKIRIEIFKYDNFKKSLRVMSDGENRYNILYQ